MKPTSLPKNNQQLNNKFAMGLFDKVFAANHKIKVEFIDNSTGQVLGVSDMLPDQLPASFSVPTTMHIREDDWTVEEATPVNSEDFIKSRQLVLKMRKITYMNPKDIKFSLPTIENTFPNLVNSPAFSGFSIRMHGDEWLQQEFISTVNSGQIEILLEQIRESAKDCDERGEIVSYEKCFVRQFPTDKIVEKIYLTDLKKEFEADSLGSLSFSNYEGYAENTFVVAALGTYFYGQLSEDHSLQTLGIYDIGSVTDTHRLETFARKMKLNFVDWVGMYQIN